MNKYIETAVRAARAAGEIIRRDFGDPTGIRFKGKGNPVTQTDIDSERTILAMLRSDFPSHDFLTEETEHESTGSEFLWIIDPLDGTTNFTHSYPFVCVSIALKRGEDFLLGVVLDPIRGQIFQAEKGGGAVLNGKPIRVSKTNSLEKSLVCTGFPYRLNEKPRDNFPIFERLCLRSEGVRRDGSAALDVCYVAAGILDGFWERDLWPWDTAAGMVILSEAGGKISDYSGNPFNPFLKEIVASNGLIHEEMLSVIANKL